MKHLISTLTLNYPSGQHSISSRGIVIPLFFFKNHHSNWEFFTPCVLEEALCLHSVLSC